MITTLIISILSPSQSIRHPSYNSFTINNDVAVIKLATPAQLNNRVSPVCLAETSDNFPGGSKCVTTGWGLTRYNGNGKALSISSEIVGFLKILNNYFCFFRRDFSH